jgi:organic radical activating enzyme
MRAANLTISIPYLGCDKNCPYCVSKMTGYPKPNSGLMGRNIDKVKTLARAAQITNVLLTGKGEPCLNWNTLLKYVEAFQDWPLELQTNGIILNKHLDKVNTLLIHGLDVVAISIDKIEQFTTFSKLFKRIHDLGMTSRVTLNVTNMIPKTATFNYFISICKQHNIDQFLLRNIVAPTHAQVSEYTKWIDENTSPEQYDKLVGEMNMCLEKFGTFLRETEFGMKIYDYRGVSITKSDYCIQDSSNGNNIRSLILLDDGHLYTNWYSKASRLF